MVIDTLDNLHKYSGLCTGLGLVADYISSHPLQDLSEGRHIVSGDAIWANVQTCPPRFRADAPLEVHREMMDVQIPLDGPEQHGYAPLAWSLVSSSLYDAQADISFLPVPPKCHFTVNPGMFVLYMPGEGHAPAITDIPLRKVVFKVKYQTHNNHA
ncbi:MAG: YhcH/YjgK/YiaL family protein [Bacteroidaceae bacterium]